MMAVSIKTRVSIIEVRILPSASGWRAMLSEDLAPRMPMPTAPPAAAMPTAMAQAMALPAVVMPSASAWAASALWEAAVSAGWASGPAAKAGMATAKVSISITSRAERAFLMFSVFMIDLLKNQAARAFLLRLA